MNDIFLYWALFSLITLWILFREDYKNYHTRFYEAFDIFLLFALSMFFPLGIAVFLSRKTEGLWSLLTKEISLENFKYFIIPIFNPLYWDRIGKYNKSWDRELSKLMDIHKFKYVDDYTAMLGPYEIWITNHPYSSFYEYIGRNRKCDHDKRGLPSRRTVAKAMEKYKKDIGVK